MIDRIKVIFKEKWFCFYACELKTSGEFIGLITIWFKAHFTSCIQIGWRLAAQYWGYGYASEGAQKCL